MYDCNCESEYLAGRLAVDHPRDAEAVDEHAKAGRPEGRLDRHGHFSAFRQGVKDTLGLQRVLDGMDTEKPWGD